MMARWALARAHAAAPSSDMLLLLLPTRPPPHRATRTLLPIDKIRGGSARSCSSRKVQCIAPTTQPENALTTKALGGTTSDDVRPRIHANSSCDSTSWMYFSRFCIGGSRIEIKILCTVGSCMHGPCPSSVGVEWDWTGLD